MRSAKETFNADNPQFLGIHHAICYDEEVLTKTLAPFIGTIAPFQFDKPTDPLIHSTHWSNADELLVFCRDLASKMPNGEFPAEDWLRKRGKHADRDGPAYNTLSVYIKQWLGGIRNLRQLIGQSEVSTIQWDKDSALAAYKAFYEEHNITPYQARHAFKKGEDGISKELAFEAARISGAVQKYAGGAQAVNALLGIETGRRSKWSKNILLTAINELRDEYDMTPTQIVYAHSKGTLKLTPGQLRRIKQISYAWNRLPKRAVEITSTP